MIVLSPTLPGRYLTWNAWGHCTADPAFEDTRAFRKFARHSKRAMQPQLRGLASANFGSGSSGGNGVVTQLVQGFGSLFGNVLTSALSSTTSGSNIYGVPSTGLDTSFIWAPLLSLITGAIN
ncbi:hypothetical protein ANO11243_077460 [Dothideomycetidae sp. 11243]|nr:hypothetical protein ANO11243_077460 [fungal sp. No.11243]